MFDVSLSCSCRFTCCFKTDVINKITANTTSNRFQSVKSTQSFQILWRHSIITSRTYVNIYKLVWYILSKIIVYRFSELKLTSTLVFQTQPFTYIWKIYSLRNSKLIYYIWIIYWVRLVPVSEVNNPSSSTAKWIFILA